MMRYRKKPVVIEAYQVSEYDYDGFLMFNHFCNPPSWLIEASKAGRVYIKDSMIYLETLEGDMRVSINDYIVRGIDGELYPCKPSIFERTYERLDDDGHSADSSGECS